MSNASVLCRCCLVKVNMAVAGKASCWGMDVACCIMACAWMGGDGVRKQHEQGVHKSIRVMSATWLRVLGRARNILQISRRGKPPKGPCPWLLNGHHHHERSCRMV